MPMLTDKEYLALLYTARHHRNELLSLAVFCTHADSGEETLALEVKLVASLDDTPEAVEIRLEWQSSRQSGPRQGERQDSATCYIEVDMDAEDGSLRWFVAEPDAYIWLEEHPENVRYTGWLAQLLPIFIPRCVDFYTAREAVLLTPAPLVLSRAATLRDAIGQAHDLVQTAEGGWRRTALSWPMQESTLGQLSLEWFPDWAPGTASAPGLNSRCYVFQQAPEGLLAFERESLPGWLGYPPLRPCDPQEYPEIADVLGKAIDLHNARRQLALTLEAAPPFTPAAFLKLSRALRGEYLTFTRKDGATVSCHLDYAGWLLISWSPDYLPWPAGWPEHINRKLQARMCWRVGHLFSAECSCAESGMAELIDAAIKILLAHLQIAADDDTMDVTRASEDNLEETLKALDSLCALLMPPGHTFVPWRKSPACLEALEEQPALGQAGRASSAQDLFYAHDASGAWPSVFFEKDGDNDRAEFAGAFSRLLEAWGFEADLTVLDGLASRADSRAEAYEMLSRHVRQHYPVHLVRHTPGEDECCGLLPNDRVAAAKALINSCRPDLRIE
jgi:hypothetical protein